MVLLLVESIICLNKMNKKNEMNEITYFFLTSAMMTPSTFTKEEF